MNERIKVLHRAEVINAMLDILYNSEHRIDICGNSRFPSLIFSFESIRGAIMSVKNRKKYTRQRYIFEITQQNIQYCRDLMKIAEIRHMNEIEANFLLNENEYLGSITLKEPHQQAVYTNVREIVQQQQNIFDTLWNKSVLAEKKIKEIEEGTIHYETRLIEDAQEIVKEISRLTASSTELCTCLTAGGMQYSYNHFFDIKKKLLDKQKKGEHKGIRYISNIDKHNVNLAKILLNEGIEIRYLKNLPPMRIFSSINAFRRQARLGIMHLFKDAVERGVRVRILIPADQREITQIVNEVNLVLPQLEIGSVDKSLESTVGILVVDRKESLIIETKNDTKDSSYDAAGLAAYSNSKPIASAYASIFDTLWKQTELHQKLSDMYERLRTQSNMQKEFIDVAAHELRTPIQPILGLTGILRSSNSRDKTSSAVKQEEMLDIIMRNARRLQRLADDILDVTKIESKSLNLKKEFFNLNDVITNSIDDIITNVADNGQRRDFIKLLYQPCDIFIDADKSRITQVISNILDNAIKFSKANVNKERGVGIININTEKIDGQAIVTITDTGTGIDPEIMPRIFDKFASKSFQGTGLGLYICKSIVEAHGGKIWAENNADEKGGATIAFSLPTS
jgi:nitrogen-specific signal transduction histidine kinase